MAPEVYVQEAFVGSEKASCGSAEAAHDAVLISPQICSSREHDRLLKQLQAASNESGPDCRTDANEIPK